MDLMADSSEISLSFLLIVDHSFFLDSSQIYRFIGMQTVRDPVFYGNPFVCNRQKNTLVQVSVFEQLFLYSVSTGWQTKKAGSFEKQI
jgi:hypothetical protein